jgi:hypothetical protein
MSKRGEGIRWAVLLVCLCLVAIGSKTIVVGADPPKTVVKKYFLAVVSNDIAGARMQAAPDPGNRLAAEMLVRMTTCHRLVIDAAIKKFGDNAKSPQNLPLSMVQFDPTLVDQSTEKIAGETAVVRIKAVKDAPPISIPLKRMDGEWKMDLNSVLKLPSSDVFVNAIREITDAIDQSARDVAADIAGGKFADAKTALTQSKARMDAAAAQKIQEISVRRKK